MRSEFDLRGKFKNFGPMFAEFVTRKLEWTWRVLIFVEEIPKYVHKTLAHTVILLLHFIDR